MSAAATAALVLVVAVEYVADADPLVTELGEIARGRLDPGVPETGLDLWIGTRSPASVVA